MADPSELGGWDAQCGDLISLSSTGVRTVLRHIANDKPHVSPTHSPTGTIHPQQVHRKRDVSYN
jgi:hypothetical protein